MANAGGPYNTFGTNPVSLTGSANVGGISWSSDGSGAFAYSDTFTPIYSPSAADLAAGTITLTMTASGDAPCGPVIAKTSLHLAVNLVGDVNGDGAADREDIQAFVNALLDGGVPRRGNGSAADAAPLLKRALVGN